jgi:hypothetical protein
MGQLQGEQKSTLSSTPNLDAKSLNVSSSRCQAQRARLQAVRMLLWNQASADPIRAAEALIKLEAREARLLGLDMPTKVAVTDPDGGIPLETIRRVMERVDRQMVDVTPNRHRCRSTIRGDEKLPP